MFARWIALALLPLEFASGFQPPVLGFQHRRFDTTQLPRSDRILATAAVGTADPTSSSSTTTEPRNNRQRRRPPRVYKHLFRHYPDISFDSWLRCADPQEFLESVGYTPTEVDEMEQAFPPLLSLDVHDQLAPKIRFLVETMGGGTGKLEWDQQEEEAAPIIMDEEECLPFSEAQGAVEPQHSMRLSDETKRVVPPAFFGCQLDRIVGPYHAYMVHSGLPHGQSLLSNAPLFDLFWQCCQNANDHHPEDFCELCQEWEIDNPTTTVAPTHSVETIRAFQQAFTPGLIPASKQQPKSRSNTTDLIPLLLAHGANFLENDANGVSPLHWAAGGGDKAGVVSLMNCFAKLEGYASTVETMEFVREPREGASPFHWACGSVGQTHNLEYEETTQKKSPIGSYDVCLFLLCQAGDQAEVLANLPTWTHGQTPIMWASYAGHFPTVDLLVLHGAKPFHQDKNQQTALHWAAAAGHSDILKYLVSTLNSATTQQQVLHQRDAAGQTPLDYARQYDRQDVVDWISPANLGLDKPKVPHAPGVPDPPHTKPDISAFTPRLVA